MLLVGWKAREKSFNDACSLDSAVDVWAFVTLVSSTNVELSPLSNSASIADSWRAEHVTSYVHMLDEPPPEPLDPPALMTTHPRFMLLSALLYNLNEVVSIKTFVVDTVNTSVRSETLFRPFSVLLFVAAVNLNWPTGETPVGTFVLSASGLAFVIDVTLERTTTLRVPVISALGPTLSRPMNTSPSFVASPSLATRFLFDSRPRARMAPWPVALSETAACETKRRMSWPETAPCSSDFMRGLTRTSRFSPFGITSCALSMLAQNTFTAMPPSVRTTWSVPQPETVAVAKAVVAPSL